MAAEDAIFSGIHAYEVRSRGASLAARRSIFKRRHENVVQRAAESPEGDGPAHQPDIPVPAESLARAGLAVREREPADRGAHRRLRRVHEPGAGRRRGVPSEDEEQEAARPDHAEGRQYHADTEHESHGELRSNITSTRCRFWRAADKSWFPRAGSVLGLYPGRGGALREMNAKIDNTSCVRKAMFRVIDECINGDLYLLFRYEFLRVSTRYD